jgi:hypothetical protein
LPVHSLARQTDCLPSEDAYHAEIAPTAAEGRWSRSPQTMEALKERAKARGLWNLFLSRKAGYKEGVDLTNVEVWDPLHSRRCGRGTVERPWRTSRRARLTVDCAAPTPVLPDECRSQYAVMAEMSVPLPSAAAVLLQRADDDPGRALNPSRNCSMGRSILIAPQATNCSAPDTGALTSPDPKQTSPSHKLPG